MDSIPDSYWEKSYCGMPLWKRVYHTLHSLDRWCINPFQYDEPEFHQEGLNDLNRAMESFLSRDAFERCFFDVSNKILIFLDGLSDEKLLERPIGCPHTRFNLILVQHRHLDMHIGMLIGYIIAGEDLWPRVMGLDDEFPEGEYSIYF